jgi:hypothetical protein
MIRNVTSCDAEIGQWIGEHLQTVLGAGAVLGFSENGKLLCGIRYTVLGRPWAFFEMTILAGEPALGQPQDVACARQLSVPAGRQSALWGDDRRRQQARPRVLSSASGFARRPSNGPLADHVGSARINRHTDVVPRLNPLEGRDRLAARPVNLSARPILRPDRPKLHRPTPPLRLCQQFRCRRDMPSAVVRARDAGTPSQS